jgi:hypothetical protein
MVALRLRAALAPISHLRPPVLSPFPTWRRPAYAWRAAASAMPTASTASHRAQAFNDLVHSLTPAEIESLPAEVRDGHQVGRSVGTVRTHGGPDWTDWESYQHWLRVPSDARTHSHTHASTHTHAHTHTHTHTHTLTHTHTYTHTHTHMHTCTHTQARTHARTPARPHAHAAGYTISFCHC